jgi:hypothetical protein
MTDDKESVRDAALDIAEFGAAGAALVVPPAALLAVVLGKITRSRTRRQAELLASLSDALEAVKDRVDHEYVESDDFEALVEEVVEKGMRRKEIDKRDYYAALLASAALPGRPDENELDAMVDTLEALRKPQLWLLGALLGDYTWPDEPSPFGPSFQQEFVSKTGADWGAVQRDWRLLEQHALAGGIPSGVMSGAGARQFRGRVTDRGVLFHQFITLPYADVHPRT